MRNFIPENTVYGFDHVAVDDTVIACNMAHTPMEDESLDVAVFSLSISWGNTFHEEYVKEVCNNPEYPAPKLWLNPEITNFYDFTFDDIKLIDYQATPSKKFEVAV